MPPLPLSGSATRRILRLSSQPPFNNPKSPHILSTRTNHIRTIHNLGPPHCPLYALSPSTPRQNPPKARTFTTTPPPPSSSPSPPQTAQSAQQPSILPIEKFHTLADTYIDNLVLHLEQLQEEREDVDVEYSVCPPSLHSPTPAARSPKANLHCGLSLTNPLPGRSPHPPIPPRRHLRPEQTTAEPADLALEPLERAEEV